MNWLITSFKELQKRNKNLLLIFLLLKVRSQVKGLKIKNKSDSKVVEESDEKDKIAKKKSSKRLVHAKGSKDAVVLSDEEGKKGKKTPNKKKSEVIEKIPVSLEPAEESPREIDEEEIKKIREINEKKEHEDGDIDEDEDKFSYQQKLDDEKEYPEDDDQSISDIKRAKDTEEEPYMFWTKEECLSELKKDSKSIKAHFRLGLVYLEEDETEQARTHFVDFCLKVDHTFRKGEIYERIGDSYFKENKKMTDALNNYKQAAKLDPFNYMFFLKQGK